MLSSIQPDISDDTCILVMCHDSNIPEHMTLAQYYKNGNCTILSPKWAIEKLVQANTKDN